MATSARTADFFRSVELGCVTLRVRDLPTVRAFYADLLGLTAREVPSGKKSAAAPSGSQCELAAAPGGPVLLVLEADPTAKARPAGTAGLFHTAILLPDPAALGRLAQRLIDHRVRFATGDHGVSEALYLDDPEGNGVELYTDRAPDDWPRASANGEVAMYTRAVDLESLLEAGVRQPGPHLPAETRIGHVHLCVSNLATAEKFYVAALGFTVRQRSFPGALFVGRDGYHHHLGLNTWQSNRPSAPGALGLAELTLTFHDRSAWETAVRNASPAADLRDPTAGVRLSDADGISVVLRFAER